MNRNDKLQEHSLHQQESENSNVETFKQAYHAEGYSVRPCVGSPLGGFQDSFVSYNAQLARTS